MLVDDELREARRLLREWIDLRKMSREELEHYSGRRHE